jgi:hypothetical protein
MEQKEKYILKSTVSGKYVSGKENDLGLPPLTKELSEARTFNTSEEAEKQALLLCLNCVPTLLKNEINNNKHNN